MPEIQIRRAMLADGAELARLRWDFSDETLQERMPLAAFTAEYVAWFERAMASGRWTFWLAVADERVLGTIFAETIDKVPRPALVGHRWAYITNVYVEPAYRNDGLGARLMRSVQAWAREEQLEFLLLWPSKRAVPFYLRAGFIRENDTLKWNVREGTAE